MSHQRNIRIGTFNVFNLVLPNRLFYKDQMLSQHDYERKIDWTARQLDLMKADIVGFQEVFHPEALAAVLARSERLRDAHFFVAAPTGDLPRVAIASRFPILAHEVYHSCPSILTYQGAEIPIHDFSRPVLQATIEFPGGTEVDIYVTHLKSKRPEFEPGEHRSRPLDLAKGQARSLIRRTIEAACLREILLANLYQRRRPIILCGDMNDTGTSVTTRIVSGEPPHRRYPMEVKKSIWDVLLYHVKDIQARQALVDVYFTHLHNGFHEAIDQIMVSEEFVRENRDGIAQVEYVQVFNDHLIDETLSDERVPVWISDHGQVVVAIEMHR